MLSSLRAEREMALMGDPAQPCSIADFMSTMPALQNIWRRGAETSATGALSFNAFESGHING
jgi:hypothetical protein